jgi:hypothetical protein
MAAMGKSEDLTLKRWLMIVRFVRQGQAANRLNARIMFRFFSKFKGLWYLNLYHETSNTCNAFQLESIAFLL